jgi:lipoate-protein ligase A
MQWLDRTAATIEENLALDEALLLEAESGGSEVLRVWHWPRYAVVLGAGGRWREETHADACLRDGVPIVRRASGGGAVLLGRGCMLFSVVLSFEREPALGDIHASYRWILGRLAAQLNRLVPNVAFAGISDLARGEQKFSGNSQQRKRRHVLHHGTILHDFELSRIPTYLAMPPRMPEYRERRTHEDFVVNLPLSADEVVACLRECWPCDGAYEQDVAARVAALMHEKYGRRDWHERR